MERYKFCFLSFVSFLLMRATEGEQWQCCRLGGGTATGATGLTKIVQGLGRTMSLFQPFLKSCSKSTCDARF